jgi:hypothetical protein
MGCSATLVLGPPRVLFLLRIDWQSILTPRFQISADRCDIFPATIFQNFSCYSIQEKDFPRGLSLSDDG